jgi:hypothetical protein
MRRALKSQAAGQAQEFVIGGYTIGGRTFDALVFWPRPAPDLRGADPQRLHAVFPRSAVQEV